MQCVNTTIIKSRTGISCIFFTGQNQGQKKNTKKSLLAHLVSFYLFSMQHSPGSKLRNSRMQPVRIVSLLLMHAPMLLLSQSISDCAKEGLYLPLNQPVFSGCSACLPGSYCPEGSLLAFLCPPGTYQDLQQKGICQDCLPNHYCAGNGTSLPTPCPEGRVSAASSSSCGECDYANFLYNVSTGRARRGRYTAIWTRTTSCPVHSTGLGRACACLSPVATRRAWTSRCPPSSAIREFLHCVL